jgi:dTDP-4-dehydrorhamnose reductase
MRLLILGGDGMLGHRLLKHLGARHDVRVTLRRNLSDYAAAGLFHDGNAYAGVEARDEDRIEQVLADFRPQAVVNCVGIVKQRGEAKESVPSIEINALLPHRLAELGRTRGFRLVHLSTDCVFSGRRGDYREDDVPDAEDIYGRSKLLGEVSGPGCVTLRTSIIGRELSRKAGLLEWFLSQRGRAVRGFRRAIFSGFTTAEMARIIERLLVEHGSLDGLFHVSSDPISKYELLRKIDAAMGLGITVEPDDNFARDRSLDSSRFRARVAYRAPSWDAMITELATENPCV